jgi:O-antigen/teichoic acid export membrane protein
MLEINFNYFLNKLYNFLYLFIVLLFSSIFYFCFKKINIIIISYIWSATFVFLFILFFIISLKKYKFIRNISIKYEKKLIKELFSYGLIVVIGSSATILLNRIDVQMITYFLNLKDVAYYQIALSIGSILTILFSPVSIILQTLSSKLILENKKEELNKLLSYIYLFILFISLPIFLILILYNKLIINLLFSSNYFYSSKLSIIILFFYYINIYLFINYSIIFGLKKLKEKNKMLIVAGIFNIILNYILIKYFDIYGAGIATLIVTSYLFIYSLIIMFKENVKINLNLRTLFKILILNLIFLGTIFILKKIAIENIYLKIIFVLIISLSEYYILGWFMKIYKINKIIDLLNIKLSKKFGFIKKI